MLLGNRGAPSIIRRTSSMSRMNVDLDLQLTNPETQEEASDLNSLDQRFMASPRNSTNHIETPHFLRTCRLCNRRLAPGRDIYMYRGDTAFCSLECREEHMKQEGRKDKWKVTSKKQHVDPPPSSTTTSSSTSTSSKASTNSETVAAA